MTATPTSIFCLKIKPANCAVRLVYGVTALQRLLDRFHPHHRIAPSKLRQPHTSCPADLAFSQTIEARPSQSALASQKH